MYIFTAPGQLLFAHTGVSQLMSISGLHIMMVASLFAALVHWLWWRLFALMLAACAQDCLLNSSGGLFYRPRHV